VSIDNYSIFCGTLVCNNGAIKLSTGDTLYGRALTTSGALSTTAIDAQIASGVCIPLSLDWVYFKGVSVDKNVRLYWGTTVGENNSYFTIEKSLDGIAFSYLGTKAAKIANDNRVQNDSFVDINPFGVGYYRIAQTDKDGKKTFYKTIQVRASISDVTRIFSFVQGDYIYIQTINAPTGYANIYLYSIEGSKIATKKIYVLPQVNIFKVVKPIQKGTYIISMERNGEKAFTNKIAF
jgi:hypothetical protein